MSVSSAPLIGNSESMDTSDLVGDDAVQSGQPLADDTFHQALESSTADQDRVAEAIAAVQEMISPVWPLRDFVAVNPFLGLSDRSFLNARSLLRSVADCDTLMPISYYQKKFQRGRLYGTGFGDSTCRIRRQRFLFAFESWLTSSRRFPTRRKGP